MKKLIVFLAIVALAAASAYGYFRLRGGKQSTAIVDFAQVVRGDIENVISCTGTIEPVSTVEVGTEVSGKINRVYVDYNDDVRKGQVLAVLDTVFLSASVREAQASIVRAEAQYLKSKKEYEHNSTLFGKNFVSEMELLNFETTMKTNYASLQSAQTSLERALFNMEHAVIRSPISGKVISRNVEEGQTVQASFSTPTLFLIAEDLANVEIEARVDESDIGQIRSGMEADFTVEAYYDRTFSGTVRQVRLQPNTVSNVVTYTVIVDASNEEGLLLPGMTATVDFILEKKEDVLMVPSTALKVEPSEEMMADLRETFEQRRREWESAGGPDSMTAAGAGRGGRRLAGAGFGGQGFGGGADEQSAERMRRFRENYGRLWVRGEDGRYSVVPVRKGLSDGAMTEVIALGGRSLEEGAEVVSKVLGTGGSQGAGGQRMDMRMMGRMFRR